MSAHEKINTLKTLTDWMQSPKVTPGPDHQAGGYAIKILKALQTHAQDTVSDLHLLMDETGKTTLTARLNGTMKKAADFHNFKSISHGLKQESLALWGLNEMFKETKREENRLDDHTSYHAAKLIIPPYNFSIRLQSNPVQNGGSVSV